MRPRRSVAWRETFLLPRAGALIEPCRDAQARIGFAFSLRASQAVWNTNSPVAASRTILTHLYTLSISSLLLLVFALIACFLHLGR